MMRSLLCLALLLVLVDYSMAYCNQWLLTVGTTECTAKDGTVIALGSGHKFTDSCENCFCKPNAGPSGEAVLSCCGYGIRAGLMLPLQGCKIITEADGCTPRMVQAHDETKLC